MLYELYGEIIIPSAVNDEIINEPARSLVDSCSWIKIKPFLQSLIEDGFYVSPAVQSYVMEQSGETWEG